MAIIFRHGKETQTWSPGALSARMLPMGDTANGFLYFQTNYHPGSRFYPTGVKDAGTGKEYFYFDLPLDQK